MFVMALALGVYVYAKQNSYKYVLYKESGTVFYKQDGQDYQQLNGEEVELSGISYIKTDAGSIAHVLFPNNSLMSVDENSEVKVEYTPKDTSVFQLLGKTYHRVKRLFQDQSYTVQTKSAIAAVRGTKFGVILGADDTASVLVTESVVDVNSVLESNGVHKIVTGGRVLEGKMVTLPNSLEEGVAVPFEVVTIPQEVKDSDWYKRNIMFDLDYDIRQVSTASLVNSLEDMDQTITERNNGTNFINNNSNNTSSTYAQPIQRVAQITFDPHILLNLEHPDICTITNSTDFQNFYIQVLHEPTRYGIYFDTLNSYMGLLRSYCADGSLSAGDKSSLQLLLVLLPGNIFDHDFSNTLPTPTPTMPAPTTAGLPLDTTIVPTPTP